MKTIQEAVAEKIVTCGETVKSTVVDKIAQIEIDRRVELATKAVNKLDSFEKDLKKVNRNDVVTYMDGEKTESMSKARYDDIEKLKQKIGELTKDLSSALEQNTEDSYAKLSDKLKKLDGGNKEAGSAEA